MIEKTIRNILKREGGFVNHPADRGGPTNYGITAKPLTNYLGREPSIEDIKHITRDDAYEIYYLQYFQQPKIDQLPQQLQDIMLDMSVNHGARMAIKLLQRMIIIKGIPIIDDGIIGHKTIKALDGVIYAKCKIQVINCLVDIRVRFYEQIVKNDDTQRVFLSGWVKRAEEFRQAVTA